MAGVSVLCAVLLLLLLGWLLKFAHGRWLAPGPFFALYWAVGLALPPILAPDYILSQAAVWYIVVLVVAFGLGTLATGGIRPPVRPPDAEPRQLNLRLLRRLVAIGTACGLVAAVVVQSANGYSVTEILSAQGLLDAAASFSVDRYAGTTQTPTIVPLLRAFSYSAALLAPFAAHGLRRRAAVACYLAPFMAATMHALVTTERLGMLAVGFFLFAGWVAATLYRRGEVPLVRLRSLLAGLTAVAVVTVAFVAVAFLRVGSFDPTAQRAIIPKLTTYAVGYMPAFSQWLPDSPTGRRSWGTATFAGLVDVGSGQSAAFAERLPVAPGLGETNIFTAWRYLIEDFGYAGAPLAAAVLGLVVAAAWRRAILRPTTGPIVVVMGGYAYMLNSVTQTVFLFTNIVLAFFVAAWGLHRRPPALKPGGPLPSARDLRRALERTHDVRR